VYQAEAPSQGVAYLHFDLQLEKTIPISQVYQA